jgi:hypothetical protein
VNNIRTAFLINSRGNPERLTGVCCAFSDSAARPDLITFCVRADLDDQATIAAAKRIQDIVPGNVELTIGPRPQALGTEINRMAAKADADFYHIINDDTWPMTRYWDVVPVAYRKSHPAFVCCWQTPPMTGNDYPIFSRAWLDAAGGKVFTDYFPYWFDDRWLGDVTILVTGKLVHALPIFLCANKKGTQRLRDFGLWSDFFMATFDERIVQAQSIADNLGLGVDIRKDRAEWLVKLPEMHRDLYENAAEIVARHGDNREPDGAYLTAKAYAESRLKEIAA